MATTIIDNRKLNAAAVQWFVLALLFGLYYAPLIPNLVTDWYEHSTFSYGFLVPFITAYLVWKEWPGFKKTCVSPDVRASLLLLVAVTIGVAGYASGDPFSTRVSMLLSLGSIVFLMLGTEITRKLLFPFFFLSLMIPVPYVFIKDLTLYLRYSDATQAANVLHLLGVPVYRESYFLHIPNMTLEVADVCSGASSVFALFALGVFYAHFLQMRSGLKVVLAICTFPLAIVANIFRIVLTVFLVYYVGPIVLQSFFHGFSGTFTFTLALLMLIGVGEILKNRFPAPARSAQLLDRTLARNDRGRQVSSWSCFILGAIILLTGLFVSKQLVVARRAIQLESGLDVVIPSNRYRFLSSDLEDGYKDPNAEYSLSKVLISGDGNKIDVFVGFRGEEKASNRLRSPKLIFPNNWNSEWLKPAEMTTDGGTTIHGNWVLARKGDSLELILYWYQIGSRTYAGDFAYRLQQLRRALFERRSDGAVIRLATRLSNGNSVGKAEERLQRFGAFLYPKLVKVLPK